MWVRPGREPSGAKAIAEVVECMVGDPGGEWITRPGGGECIRLGEWPPKSLRGGGERRRVLVGAGELCRFGGGGE